LITEVSDQLANALELLRELVVQFFLRFC